MTWTDKKKWQMDLVTKLLMAFTIAIVGAGSAYFIDQGFQKKLAQQNANLQKQLADERFLANRTEVKAQTLESIGNRFMETAYSYSNALEAAFKDTYYRHKDFHADSKGQNQLRYENDLNPKLNSILSQISVLCSPAEEAITSFHETKQASFRIYNSIENKDENAQLSNEWKTAKIEIERKSESLQAQAAQVYKLILNCVNNIAYNRVAGGL